MQVVQPVGQDVQLEAPAAEKVPVAQAAQALDPPVENWLAEHWVQAPPERPKPESQLEQEEPLEQAEHPVGQEVHAEAPAAEKVPEVQLMQVELPPFEKLLAAHWVQLPLASPYPESQAEQLETLVQVVQPVGQVVHEWAPAAEKVPVGQ